MEQRSAAVNLITRPDVESDWIANLKWEIRDVPDE